MLTKLEAPQNYKRLINKEKEKKDVIQIIDDEGFLREVSFDDLTSHPTTLAGYGITDAYIANGTIYLGDQSITPASVSSLGTAAYKDYTTSVTQGGADLPTSDAVFQAIGAAVSSALHYRGISSTVITDGGTETAVIGGQPLVVQSGDVVIYSGFEFLWENNVWNKLGDDTSFALKTVQITGDGIYITGGGDLTTSRSLDLSQAAKDALTLASTALQSVAFSDLTSHPTTISGYGITDAKIVNGVITLGSNTITPLTSFTESDPVFSASAASEITSNDILAWNAKYSKPSGGIPKSDLATSVQTSLEKADTALQSESDPTVPAWAKNSSLAASDVPTLSISKISGLQDALDGKQPLDADLTAIAALTGSGLLRRSSNNTWSLDTNTYLTSSDHKALTLKVGTITIGSDFNSLAAKTYTITKANITDTIGDTTYAPYHADGYLPLSAGSSNPLTNDLYFTKTIYGEDVQVGRIGSVIDGGIVTYFTNPSSGSGSGTGPGFAIINTPYEKLLFWLGSTDDSLEIYHEGNLTKGVLTTLLESNNGYYVKKSGDTMTGTLYSQNIMPVSNTSYDLGASVSKWNNIYTRALYATIAKVDGLLAIPTAAPASGSIVSGEAYLYSSTGSYAESPGGGVTDVYPLTITKNGSAWLSYNPGSAATTINLAIPTKVSDLTNDTGFITASSIPSTYAWSAITNTPTTLSGYGITDAKIETPSGTSNRKITLGSNNLTIYSWALASAKPSYTLDEVADGSTRKLANYLPLAGNAVASKITGNVVLGNNVFLQGVHTNGTDVRELIGLDNNNIVTVGCSTNQLRLITSSVDIKHNKNGTLYSVYDESNLTKSVLTTLLDSNGGYYLPLTAGSSKALTGDLYFDATSANKNIYFKDSSNNLNSALLMASNGTLSLGNNQIARGYSTVVQGGTIYVYWDTSAATKGMVFTSSTIRPTSDNGINLGYTNYRWASFHSMSANLYGNLAFNAPSAGNTITWVNSSSVTQEALGMRSNGHLVLGANQITNSKDTYVYGTNIYVTWKSTRQIHFTGDTIIPNSSNAIDLGTSSNYWKGVYAGTLYGTLDDLTYLTNHALNIDNAAVKGVNFHYANAGTKPTGSQDGSAFTLAWSSAWVTQMYGDWRTNKFYTRVKTNGTWGDWAELATTKGTVEGLNTSTETDATFVHRAVPSVAVGDVARVTKVKGKTIVWNQLCQTTWFATGSFGGVSWTNNGDGSYTINNTTTSVAQKFAYTTARDSWGDHKYYLATSDSSIAIYFNGTTANQGTYTDSRQIVTAQASDTYYPTIRIASGVSFSNKKVYIKIIDLTLMFGKGSEPASVDEFETLYPLPYYAYNPGELISNKTESIETGFNLLDENTMFLNVPGIVRKENGWSGTSAQFANYGYHYWDNKMGLTGQMYIYMKAQQSASGGNFRFTIAYTDGTSESGPYMSGTSIDSYVISSAVKTVSYIRADYGSNRNVLIQKICLARYDATSKCMEEPYETDSLHLNTSKMVNAKLPKLKLNQLAKAYDSTDWVSIGTSYSTKSTDSTTQEIVVSVVSNTSAVKGVKLNNFTSVTGHKYYIRGEFTATCHIGMYNSSHGAIANAAQSGEGIIGTATSSVSYFGLRTPNGATSGSTYRFKNIVCIDLTAMYGSGNEPASAAEVEELVGNYHPYTTGEDMPNYIFPKGLKGAGTAYDEASGKKAIKRIGVVDLGTLNWELYTTDTTNHTFKAACTGMKAGDEAVVANCRCSKYYTGKFSYLGYWQSLDKVIAITGNAAPIFIRDTAYSDASTFQAAMAGVKLYYELATPVEYETESTLPELVDNDTLGTQKQIPSVKTTNGGIEVFPEGPQIVYGLSAEVHDEVHDNIAIKRIGIIDLGDLTYSNYTYTAGSSTYPWGYVPLNISDRHSGYNIRAIGYETVSGFNVCDYSINPHASNASAYLINSSFIGMTGAQIKAALKGVKCYYELATPVTYTLDENSISAPFRCDFQYGANPGEIVSDSSYRYLPLAGGTVTGTLEASGELIIPDHAPYQPEPNKHYLYVNDNGNYYQS